MNRPQQLSREAIDEFKAHYKAEFGKVLSDDEVQEMAMQLLRFFGILVGPRSNEINENKEVIAISNSPTERARHVRAAAPSSRT